MKRRDMIEETIKKLEDLENDYYNAFEGNVFETAIYLYMRYGEIPMELESENKLEKVSKCLRKADSLFDESINNEIQNLF